MALIRKADNTHCRLCLVTLSETNTTLIDGLIKDMLEVILPELNLAISPEPPVCKDCVHLLEQSYNFKSSCLRFQDKIHEFVGPGSPDSVDLKDVVRKLNSDHVVSTDEVVCRTCLEVGKESLTTKLCSPEGYDLRNMIEKCLPEMSLLLTKDPCICASCLEQLEEQFNFVIQCTDTEAKIKYYTETKRIYQDINLHKVYEFTECLEESYEVDKGVVNIAASSQPQSHVELIDLTDDTSVSDCKDRKENGSGDFASEVASNFNGDAIISAPAKEITNDMETKEGNELLIVTKVTRLPRKMETRSNNENAKLKRKHDDGEDAGEDIERSKKRLRMSKCQFCEFKTKFASRMKAHITVNHASQVSDDPKDSEQVYRCRSCNFKTTDADELKVHKECHKQKCPECGLTFGRSDSFRKHVASHKACTKSSDAASSQQQQQQSPSFKMIRPKSFKNLFNINGKVLKMFRCQFCPYQTRSKTNYNRHVATHKMTTTINTHKCKICAFETIQKENYLSHMQGHDKEAGEKGKKCFLCSYQPPNEDALRQHVQQVHKSGSA